jgi:hypothetical protein
LSQELFDEPTNLFEKRISELFAAKPSTEFDSIMRLVTMIIADTAPSDDMVALYHLLPMEQFVKVVNLFDGRQVRFFARKDIQDALILALCFYHKEVEGLDWKDISQKVPFAISPISYGSKIKKLGKIIRMNMEEILRSGA